MKASGTPDQVRGDESKIWPVFTAPSPRPCAGVPLPSGEQVEHVLPVWIISFDQVELPCARPPFEALFLFYAGRNVFTPFRPHQARQAIANAEIGACAGSVLVDAGGQV